MAVITISGNLGSGGQIGRIVAHRLGLDFVDDEVLTEAARALRLCKDAVAARDGELPAPAIHERLVSFLQEFLDRAVVAGVADPLTDAGSLETLMATTYREAAALPVAGKRDLSHRRYKEAITSVVAELAAKSNVVIVGRGGQAILKGHPRCLHVRITAPIAVRIRRIAAREGLSAEKAKERVEESDKARLDYHRKYFKIDPADPDLYDIVLNMTHISEEDAAELIAAALPFKMPAPV
jgi:cytidylate kinase